MVLHVRRRLPALRRASHEPFKSDDLTDLIVREGRKFVVLWSPETAGHDPDYRELGRFATRREAEVFLTS